MISDLLDWNNISLLFVRQSTRDNWFSIAGQRACLDMYYAISIQVNSKSYLASLSLFSDHKLVTHLKFPNHSSFMDSQVSSYQLYVSINILPARVQYYGSVAFHSFVYRQVVITHSLEMQTVLPVHRSYLSGFPGVWDTLPSLFCRCIVMVSIETICQWLESRTYWTEYDIRYRNLPAFVEVAHDRISLPLVCIAVQQSTAFLKVLHGRCVCFKIEGIKCVRVDQPD